MPKTHSGWSRDDPYDPRPHGIARWIPGGFRDKNNRLFQNESIDGRLKRGQSAEQIKKSFKKEMGGLSKRDQDKIMRRIDERAHKHGQGKDGKKK